MAMTEQRTQLLENLKKLAAANTSGSFLVATCGDIYAQFMPDYDARTMRCETVGNENLPEPCRLTDDKQRQLEALGFKLDGSGNFARDIPWSTDGDLSAIADAALDIFARIYGAPPAEGLSFDLTIEK